LHLVQLREEQIVLFLQSAAARWSASAFALAASALARLASALARAASAWALPASAFLASVSVLSLAAAWLAASSNCFDFKKTLSSSSCT